MNGAPSSRKMLLLVGGPEEALPVCLEHPRAISIPSHRRYFFPSVHLNLVSMSQPGLQKVPSSPLMWGCEFMWGMQQFPF